MKSNLKLKSKMTSLILTLTIVISAFAIPAVAEENNTNNPNLSLITDSVELSNDVRNAIIRDLSDNDVAPDFNTSNILPYFNKYSVNNAGFWSYDDISISKENGLMSYSKDLFHLDATNDLDVDLGLRFDSDSATYNSNGTSTSNFYDSRYNLGIGWSLNLPTIEIDGNIKYLHTSNGEKYKVGAQNKLEGYMHDGLSFANAGTNEFSVNSVVAAYRVTDINDNKYYFTTDGNFLGVKDVLNNKIKVFYSNGLIQKIVEPAGRYVKFDYSNTNNSRTVVLKLYDNTETNPDSERIVTINEEYDSTNEYYYLSSIVDAIDREISFEYSQANNTVTEGNQSYIVKSINLSGVENYNGAYLGIEYTTKETSLSASATKEYKAVSKCFKKDTKSDNTKKMETTYDYQNTNTLSWRFSDTNLETLNQNATMKSTAFENQYGSEHTEKLCYETTIDSYSRNIQDKKYSLIDEDEETISVTEYSDFDKYYQPRITINKTKGTGGSYLLTKTTNKYDKYGNVLDSVTVSGSKINNSVDYYPTYDAKSSNSYNYNLSKSTPTISAEFTKAESNAVYATVTFNSISNQNKKITSSTSKTYDMTSISQLSDLQNANSTQELTKTDYTYSSKGNLTKEVETDLTYEGVKDTSYKYDGKYQAYVIQTNQSGVKNADGQSTFNVNGSSDIVTRSEYDMFGNETVSYDAYNNKTFKYYDNAGNLIRTGEYKTPYHALFDWENEIASTYYPNISGLNTDTTAWSADFSITNDLSHLCSGSNKGLKIQNKVSYTANCRVALTVTQEMMENSLGIRFFVATAKNNGGVKVTFKDYQSIYYDVYSNSNKNGTWIDISWNSRMYKNGPSVWEWTYGNETDLRQTKTIWITLQNMEAGETAYLDDILVLKNQSDSNIETISQTSYNFNTNTTITSNKDGTGSKTVTDNFGNTTETYEKLPNGQYKKTSETTYNKRFSKVSEKNYVTPQLYTTTSYKYNEKGELEETVEKDQDFRELSKTEYSHTIDTSNNNLYNISCEKVSSSGSGETRATETKTYTDASGNNIKTENISSLKIGSAPAESETTEEYNSYSCFGELLKNSGDEIETEHYIQDSTGDTVATAYGDEDSDEDITFEVNVEDGFDQTISESDANTVENADDPINPNSPDAESGELTKYDAAGREIEKKTPFEKSGDDTIYSIVKTEYDANGNVSREKTLKENKNGTDIYYEKINTYDAKNNLIMVQQRNGNKSQFTQYLYDENNRVIRIYSGLSKSLNIVTENNISDNGDSDYSVIGYTYDFYGNKTSYTDQFGKTEYYNYNQYSGLLESVTKRDGTTVTYTYDVKGNVLTETATNTTKDCVKKTYTYNCENNVKTATISKKSPNANSYSNEYKTEYTYDLKGRVVSEKTTNYITNKVTNKAYEYDTKGNVTKTTVSKVVSNTPTTLYAYDYAYNDDGNLSEETVSVAGTQTQAKINYTYDANGNILTRNITDTNNNSTKHVNSTYSYNLANMCVSEEHDTGVGFHYSNYYYYTPDGNMSEKHFSWGVNFLTTNYTYDKLNRLTSEGQTEYINNKEFSYEFTDTYTYDDYNNIIEKDHNDRNDNNDKVITNTYNKTRLVTQTETDSDDNQLSQTSYTYDDNGNMSEKEKVVGEDTTTTAFSYDALDRTESIGNNTFAYDCDGNRIAKNTTETVWNNGEISADLTGNDVKVFTEDNSVYCENGEFTFNAIDSKGDVLASTSSYYGDYTYDAWGNDLYNTNTTNPIGYRGYYLDSETGLYYLKARYYDSTTGQFTQEDTVQDDNLQYNFYGYCSANPVLYVDPDGHMTGAIAAGYYVGSYMSWNPAGWIILGVTTAVVAGVGIYYAHRSLRNGSKKRLNDKHTKPRPGRNSEKKKKKPGWQNKSNKKRK